MHICIYVWMNSFVIMYACKIVYVNVSLHAWRHARTYMYNSMWGVVAQFGALRPGAPLNRFLERAPYKFLAWINEWTCVGLLHVIFLESLWCTSRIWWWSFPCRSSRTFARGHGSQGRPWSRCPASIPWSRGHRWMAHSMERGASKWNRSCLRSCQSANSVLYNVD